MTGHPPYAVPTREEPVTELPGEDDEWGSNDYVVNFRLPRKLWIEWGHQVGTGETRRGGRSERLVQFIKSEVRTGRDS